MRIGLIQPGPEKHHKMLRAKVGRMVKEVMKRRVDLLILPREIPTDQLVKMSAQHSCTLIGESVARDGKKIDSRFSCAGVEVVLTPGESLRDPTRMVGWRRDGVQLVVYQTDDPMPVGDLHHQLLLRARAVDGGVFTVATTLGRDDNSSHPKWSHSMMVDPWGELLVDLGVGETARILRPDFTDVTEARKRFPKD